MRVFLSHASEDERAAAEICLALRGAGHDVFFDENDLPPGGDYNSRIREALENSDAFVFLISPHSVGRGRYTLTELHFAEQKWPKPWGRVLAVIIADTPREQIDPYLQAGSVLTPKGSAAAEVAAAVTALPESKQVRAEKIPNGRRPPWLKRALIALASLAAAAILAPIGTFIFDKTKSVLTAPKLDAWTSYGAIAVWGQIEVWGQEESGNAVNFALVADYLKQCVVMTIEADEKGTEIGPWPYQMHLFTTIVVHNPGMSELTKLKFSLVGDNLGPVETTQSAGLSVSTELNRPLGGLDEVLVTIDRLGAGETGFVTITQSNVRLNMTPSTARTDSGRDFSVNYPPTGQQLRFLGAAQEVTGNLYPWTLVEMLQYQSEMYGRPKLYMPRVALGRPARFDQFDWKQWPGNCVAPSPKAYPTVRWQFEPNDK